MAVKEYRYKIIDDSGNIVEQTTSKLDVLKTKLKELQTTGESLDIGSDVWKKNQQAISSTEKALTKAQNKTDGFAKSLEKIPGPIGQLSQGITGMGKAATAFVTNPFGAILGVIAITVTALTKALGNTEKGIASLNKITAVFGEIIDPIVGIFEDFAALLAGGVAKGLDLIGKLMGGAAAEAGNLADSTTKLEQAEKNAEVARAKTNLQLAEARELLSDTNASYADRKKALDEIRIAEGKQTELEVKNAQEKLRIAKALYEAHDDDLALRDKMREAEIALAGVQQDSAAKQRQFNKEQKKLDAEKDAADKQRAKEAEDRRKQELANRKAAADKIRQLDEANTLASIENEKERDLKAQEFARAAQLREIENMTVTAKEKARLKEEIEEANRLKLRDINKKYDEIDKKNQEEKAAKDKQIADQISEALANTEEEKFALQQQKTRENYDALIKQAGDNAELVKELEKTKNEELATQQKDYDDKKKKDAKDTEDAITADLIAAIKAREEIQLKYLDIVDQAGQFISAIAGENKKLQIAGLVIEKAAAIGKIVASTAASNAVAVASSPLTAGQPWVGINTASAALGIATTIATTAKSIAEINSSGTEAGGGKEQPAKSSSYADGGLLAGRRHANGGIMTPFGELEGGEFVINRSSTQSFLPLLEMINNMGVGKNGGMNNLGSNIENSSMGQSPIIKTYVVASDVTSQQEADKRIEDLARL